MKHFRHVEDGTHGFEPHQAVVKSMEMLFTLPTQYFLYKQYPRVTVDVYPSMTEEAEKTLSSKLSDYLCIGCVAVIFIVAIGIYLYLDFFGPFPLPPPLEQLATVIGAGVVLVLLLIVLPVGIIVGIIYDRRKKARLQSVSAEPLASEQEKEHAVLAKCPICGASLQGEEQFCPSCGAAIPRSQ